MEFLVSLWSGGRKQLWFTHSGTLTVTPAVMFTLHKGEVTLSVYKYLLFTINVILVLLVCEPNINASGKGNCSSFAQCFL